MRAPWPEDYLGFGCSNAESRSLQASSSLLTFFISSSTSRPLCSMPCLSDPSLDRSCDIPVASGGAAGFPLS